MMSHHHSYGSGDYRYRGHNRYYGEDRINPADVPPSRHAVFVRGLPGTMFPEDVRDHFREKFGECSVNFSKYSLDRQVMFVAIRFDSRKDADACMITYEGRDLFGYRCDISWYRDIRKYATVLASKKSRNELSSSNNYSPKHERSRHRRRRTRSPPQKSRSVSSSRSKSRLRSRSASMASSHSRSRSPASKEESDEDRRPKKFRINSADIERCRERSATPHCSDASSENERERRERKKKQKKSKKNRRGKRDRSFSDAHSEISPARKKGSKENEVQLVSNVMQLENIGGKSVKEFEEKASLIETEVMSTSFKFNLDSDIPPKKLVRAKNCTEDRSDESDIDVIDDTEEHSENKVEDNLAIEEESRMINIQKDTNNSQCTSRNAKFPVIMELTKEMRTFTKNILGTIKTNQNNVFSLSLLSHDGSLSLNEREALIAKLSPLEREQLHAKYSTLFKQYQNDCRTYVHVVNKFLEKNCDLEKSLKKATIEVVNDLEHIMMKKIDELLEQLHG